MNKSIFNVTFQSKYKFNALAKHIDSYVINGIHLNIIQGNP